MADDPRIHWSLANPFGIAIDVAADTWWSGRVFDVLELDNGDAGVLAATETGGAWMVTAGGDALPLSNDWTNPDLNALAAGPDGPRHFFAAGVGGVIYETDASHTTPLLAWTPINAALPGAALATAAAPVPGFVVYDLAVLRGPRLILAATSTGLYWSRIPETPPWWCVLAKAGPSGGKRPPYQWNLAIEDKGGPGAYFSLAFSVLGARTKRGAVALEDIGVIAGGTSQGIFLGRWTGGQLLLRHVEVTWPGVGVITDLQRQLSGGPTSVAVSEGHPTIGYAITAQADGRVQNILRTTDGGQNWNLTQGIVKSAAGDQDVRVLAGDQGGMAVPNNCIAVDPDASGVVAFGWQAGTFVSPDGCGTWLPLGGVHHGDIHVLRFTPPAPDGQHRLYMGSDGGLAQINIDDALALKPLVARSDYNRSLATMQFYATYVTRQFYGTTSISPDGRGHVSAGVHDNGNITCILDAVPTPWVQIDGGDGGWTAIVGDGGLVRNLLDLGNPPNNAVRQASATSTGFAGNAIVPVVVPMPVDAGGLVSPVGDVVRRPRYRNDAGQRMFAVAARPFEVHGLFQDGPEQTYHWERLGLAAKDLGISAVASFSGATVMVGESGGRIFAMDSKNGSSVDLPVVLPVPSAGAVQKGGYTSRIAMLREDIGFALLNATDKKFNYVLRLQGLKWVVPASIGLPLNAAFYGLDGFLRRDGRPVVFACTDDRVYLSEDAGEHWVSCASGLPRSPHCADLRVGQLGNTPVLLLGTFGRSLWRADLQRLQESG